METRIESPHFIVSNQLQDYVHNKVARLEHLNQRIIKAEVLLKLDKSDTDDNKICEIRLLGPRMNLYAENKALTFKEAIRSVIHSLASQIRKRKTRYDAGDETIDIPDNESIEEANEIVE